MIAEFKNLVVELKDGNKILFAPSCSFMLRFGDNNRWFWTVYDVKGRIVFSIHNKLVKKRGIGYVS